MLSSVCVIDSCKHCPNDDFTDYPLAKSQKREYNFAPGKKLREKKEGRKTKFAC
mgnify:CR=1 FL=1|jgi:hypothetical protein